MQKKADNQKYAEDKPKDCSYCYFWNSRKNGCSKEECYYRLLPEEPFEEKKNRRLRKKKNLPVFVRTRKQRSSRWKGSVRKSRER